MFEIMQHIYMNDSYFDSDIPWTQYSLKPQFLNLAINLGYAMFIVYDESGDFKYVMDTACLFLSIAILIFRYIYPLF